MDESFEQFALEIGVIPRSIERRMVPVHPIEVVERFQRRVIQTSTCWWWDGPPNQDGYGRFWYRRADGTQRVVNAHIFAWEVAQRSGIVHDAEVIRMHLCNHTLCVRIHEDHVRTGTQQENVRYADRLGRRRGRAPVHHESPAVIAVQDRNSALAPGCSADQRLF